MCRRVYIQKCGKNCKTLRNSIFLSEVVTPPKRNGTTLNWFAKFVTQIRTFVQDHYGRIIPFTILYKLKNDTQEYFGYSIVAIYDLEPRVKSLPDHVQQWLSFRNNKRVAMIVKYPCQVDKYTARLIKQAKLYEKRLAVCEIKRSYFC